MKNNTTQQAKNLRTSIIIILMILICGTATAQVLQQDSLALVAFYNSTGGPGLEQQLQLAYRPGRDMVRGVGGRGQGIGIKSLQQQFNWHIAE